MSGLDSSAVPAFQVVCVLCCRVRCRRVSGRQLDLLWEYLNSHKDIAVAFNRSLQAKEYSKQKWKEVAEILNSQGDGAHKDWRSWSKYWVDYKAKLKKRIAAVRASQARTGGGPASEQPLTDIDAKFLQILGYDYGQGLHGVRVEPFAEPPQNEMTQGTIMTQETIFNESPSVLSIIVNPSQEISVLEIPREEQSTEVTLLAHSPPPIRHQPASPQLRHRSASPQLLHQSASPPLQPTPATNLEPTSPQRRRRRNRREQPLSQQAARRALVNSSQQKADAATRSAIAFESIAQSVAEAATTLKNIERCAFWCYNYDKLKIIHILTQ